MDMISCTLMNIG
ncbi:hypothetical protein CP10743SC13_0419A, partial [Chlamydia psittaci 10_743_SC13]